MFGRIYNPELRHYKIMASIFDQYEKAAQTYVSTNFSRGGGVDTRLEDKTPIFSKKRVNFSPSDSITHFCVCSDAIIIAMANNILLRINLRQPDRCEEIELGKFGQYLELKGMYLDPLGQHCLLSMISKTGATQPELLYLHRTSSRLKQLVKFKGHEVTTVGWNYHNKQPNTTGPILLGTSRGLILESEISCDNEAGLFQSGLEDYFKQVFDIGKGVNTTITGIQFIKVPNTDKYLILVTTSNRLYQFVDSVNTSSDKPRLQHVFKNYLSIPENYEEIETKLRYSQLLFNYDVANDVATSFGWLTGSGVLFGKINSSHLDKNVLTDAELLKFTSNDDSFPKSFVMTDFHVLLLYSDNVKGVSLLNHQLVFEDYYIETHGKLISLTKDPVKGALWAFTDKNVFNYKVIREDRNVWMVYLDRGQYELARHYCKDNEIYLDQVVVRQAEDYFKNGEFELSAKYYAQAKSISFEEVSLLFLQSQEIDSLKLFLKLKLNNLKKEDKTQITMVVVWLIELYLSQLGKLRELGDVSNVVYNDLQSELDELLKTKLVLDCIRSNKGTIYDLMTSHGDIRNLIKFTIENHDYERVIRLHIYKDDYLEALKVLQASTNRKDLFYQFAPTLIQFIPKETVQVLMQQKNNLNPAKLLPALLMCSDKDSAAVEAIKYLEFCVHVLHCPDQALHNYLLSLYAMKNHEKLMNYLHTQGQDASAVNYDIHYALRLCREEQLTEACVQLSALLGLWETAVELALKSSVKLAKETANRPCHDPQLTKKLWLMIAENVVKGKEDIKQAMEFLKECEYLRIEDILPFFSDFVTIDDFKDSICSSLQDYNQHIQDLKQEMNDATKSAEIIRQEISAFKNRYAVIKNTDNCSICDLQLLLRPFYFFPCGHLFHTDCLMTELLPLLPEETKSKLFDLQKQSNQQLTLTDNISNSSNMVSRKDFVKNEIDNIVASDCLYCGQFMIQLLDQPFIAVSEYDQVHQQWL